MNIHCTLINYFAYMFCFIKCNGNGKYFHIWRKTTSLM